MPHHSKHIPVSSQFIMDDLMGAWRTQVIVAAVELGVFGHIHAGKRTLNEISAAAGASRRGMANLLDALAAIHYLRKTRDRYSLVPVSAEFLVPGKKTYIGAATLPVSLNWDVWKHLTEAIRTGNSREAVDVAEKGKEFFPKLVASIFPGNFATSTALVAGLSARDLGNIRNILDVAAGSAAWSLPFAQAIPEARVTTVDFAEITPITRQFVDKFGVADRYEYREGDLRQIDFGRKVYDLVILGHIVHSEGEKHGRELIRQSFTALRPGGRLLIAEYVPNDTRTGPPMPVLFGLNMLLYSKEGNVFTLREYRTWLKAAGFRKVKTVPLNRPATLILATK